MPSRALKLRVSDATPPSLHVSAQHLPIPSEIAHSGPSIYNKSSRALYTYTPNNIYSSTRSDEGWSDVVLDYIPAGGAEGKEALWFSTG